MIEEIYVKNFVLIKEARISLKPGMNVFSGETGTGKSLLIGALSLLVGGAAQTQWIRAGETEAIIEASLDISKNSKGKLWLQKNDYPLEDETLILRRILNQEGKNKVYINGVQSTVKQLAELTEFLFDLTGQFEQQKLLKEDMAGEILDLAASQWKIKTKMGFDETLTRYHQAYASYKELILKKETALKSLTQKEERFDFLKYQVGEIQNAKLETDDEDSRLETEKARVKNASQLLAWCQTFEELLYTQDASIISSLESRVAGLERLGAKDQGLLGIKKELEEALTHLHEAHHLISQFASSIDLDPMRLDQIESRLFELQKIKKKYGGSLSDAKKKLIQLEEELNLLVHTEIHLQELDKNLEAALNEIKILGQELSCLRNMTASCMEEKINKQLKELAMPGARFRVALESLKGGEGSQFSKNGLDSVEFLFSANQGVKEAELSRVASGGELSRILLAIKTALLFDEEPLSCLFDEIDAGIGGGVAEIVGRKLKQISKIHQVLCVTHSPQVAALADQHYVIHKTPDKQTTKTQISVLGGIKEREEEIARMLTGVEITDKAKAHAREMLFFSEKNEKTH